MNGNGDSLGTVFTLTFALYGLMALGALLRRLSWLTPEADTSLLRINVRLLMPCLILTTLPGNAALDNPGQVIFPPLLGFLTIIVGTFIAWAIARRVAGLKQDADVRTFAFITGVYNYGYIPIPLVQMLGDRETLGVLFLFNLGVDIALWTFCIAVLTGGRDRFSLRRLATPMTLVIPLALLIHYTHATRWLPEFVFRSADMLGQCTIPLALLLIGATTYDLFQSEKSPMGHLRAGLVACVLRLGVLPLLFIGAALLIPQGQPLRNVLAIQAAMPCATFPIIMIRHYGGNSALALAISGATWIAGLATIPLIILFAQNFCKF